MDELLRCTYCDFRCSSHHLLLKHIRVHENLPDFLVYCSICGKSARKWASLRKHLQRCHKDIPCEYETPDEITSQTQDLSSLCNSNDQFVDGHDAIPSSSIHNSALFLLKTSNSLSLTHSGVDELCKSTQLFVESVASKIKDQVFQALETNNVQVSSLLHDQISFACDVDDLFFGLSTRSNREIFYRNNLHFIVMIE